MAKPFNMRKRKTLSRLFLIHHADRVRFAAYTTTPGLLLGVSVYGTPGGRARVFFYFTPAGSLGVGMVRLEMGHEA